MDDSGTVPRVNLTYKFDGDHLVYATYSEGFRPGGVNRNDGTTYKPGLPEELRNRLEDDMWLDNRLRFNGAVFREEWTDVQFSFLPPGGSGLTVIDNVGAARIDGIEADVTWAPMDGLTLSGGVSWLDAKLTKDYFTDPDRTAGGVQGRPPAGDAGVQGQRDGTLRVHCRRRSTAMCREPWSTTETAIPT